VFVFFKLNSFYFFQFDYYILFLMFDALCLCTSFIRQKNGSKQTQKQQKKAEYVQMTTIHRFR